MKDYLTIVPGIGIGDFRFGLTPDEICDAFGPASAEVVYTDAGDIQWSYSRFLIEASFYTVNQRRLGMLATKHRDATLWGAPILAVTTSELLMLFRLHCPAAPVTEDWGKGVWMYSWDSCGCHVTCVNDRVFTVQIGVIFSLEDGCPMWPP